MVSISSIYTIPQGICTRQKSTKRVKRAFLPIVEDRPAASSKSSKVRPDSKDKRQDSTIVSVSTTLSDYNFETSNDHLFATREYTANCKPARNATIPQSRLANL